MKLLIVVLLIITLTGCFNRPPPEIRDRITEVPKVVSSGIVAPADVEIKRPLPIDEITENTPDPEVARLYDLTVEQLSSEVKRLLEALRPFVEASEDDNL